MQSHAPHAHLVIMTQAPPLPFTDTDLVGKLLIAMPGMGDPRFDHSVVFLCAHSDQGAMGLIVNKQVPDISFADLLQQLDIPVGSGAGERGIFFGGPVEGARGFVLHSRDYDGGGGTMEVDDTFGMTATKDILEAMASGSGPRAALAALGYAGWGPGQLEDELQQNAWLTVEADEAIVYEADNGAKWQKALAKLGIDPLMLSATGGSA